MKNKRYLKIIIAIMLIVLTFVGYNINEIFEEINALNKESFSIVKEGNKDKIKIEFIILRKKKSLYIDLIKNEFKNFSQSFFSTPITILFFTRTTNYCSKSLY